MKVFAVLFLLLVLVGGIGFYRGWFSMSSDQGSSESRNVDVNLTVDRDKMEADADAVKDKVEELTGDAKDEVNKLVQPATDSSPSE
ncbi:hypothetical protein SV7mr_30380 [Stieleria bergensis]|uniref:Uncharacterized protein n=1 Tax=Stieleria bergensis TaxID=2528025 RepID=A0A517SWK2_9BACT|nr:hypothetical protein SV7mr_30380 [Planctomycetes bacterium SV_7m_r]